VRGATRGEYAEGHEHLRITTDAGSLPPAVGQLAVATHESQSAWRVWTPRNKWRCRLALSPVRFGPTCGRPKRSKGSPEDGRKRCGITAISAARTWVRGGKRTGCREISDNPGADRKKPWSRPRQTRIAVLRPGLTASDRVSFSEKALACSGPGSASSWVAAWFLVRSS